MSSGLYLKFDPNEMEVSRSGDDLYCPHEQISTNGFGTKGVCIKCGAMIVGKELPSQESCENCNGSGWEDAEHNGKCPACAGTGFLAVVENDREI